MLAMEIVVAAAAASSVDPVAAAAFGSAPAFELASLRDGLEIQPSEVCWINLQLSDGTAKQALFAVLIQLAVEQYAPGSFGL